MKYDDKFKVEAIRLSNEIGVANAAKKLGIPYYTIADWRKTRSNNELRAEAQKANEITNMTKDQLLQLVSQQQEEIKALKKENEDVEKANEILKDALGFFVIDRKKK